MLHLFTLTDVGLLSLYLFHSPLKVVRLEVGLLHTRHEKRCIGEEMVHFFQRTLCSFGKDSPEEESVGEVADLRTVSNVKMVLEEKDLQ